MPTPIILCTDLISGPRSGNTDTSLGQTSSFEGTIVTIWAINAGSSQSASKVFLGGVEQTFVYYWGNATSQYSCSNLYNGYQNWQTIIFQVSHLTPLGPQNLVLQVNGVNSAPAIFTVAASGNIRYAKPGASNGNGNFNSPFNSIQYMFDNLAPGDVGYILAGFTTPIGLAMRGNTLPPDDVQVALVAYPGVDAYNSDIYQDASGSGGHCVFSKLRIRGSNIAGAYATIVRENSRIVGCEVQVPGGYGSSGSVGIFGSVVKLLTTEFSNCGIIPADEQYHVVYRHGRRGVASGTQWIETDCEMAYNYFHSNGAARAFNCFNAHGNGNNPIGNQNIHHNVILDQQWAGIGLQAGVVGDNFVYDNLVVRTGRMTSDPVHNGSAVAMELVLSYPFDYPTPDVITLTVVNNTFIDGGEPVASDKGIIKFHQSPIVLTMKNNIFNQPTGMPYVSQGSDAIPSAGPGITNNLWYGAGSPPLFDINPLNVDPGFVLTTAPYNYRLASNSLAKNAGAVTGVSSFDLDGNQHPNGVGGANSDLGAYQTPVTTTGYFRRRK